MPKARPNTLLRLLTSAVAVGLGISPGAVARSQSLLELHRDKLHRAMDCSTDCDLDWTTWAVRRSSEFSVKVAFRGRPISGVKVTLTSEDPLPDGSGRHVMASKTTDPDGVARFSSIPSGRYIAHVNEGLLAQSQDVAVAEENPSTGELRLEWPVAPVATRNMRGWVTAWKRATPQNHSQRVPLPNVQVQLFDLRSGELLGATRTGDDGYYEFPGASGLFVVRVSEGEIAGMKGYDEAVEVASNAVSEHMPGLVVDQVCGSGLEELDDRASMQEPCVPTGASDPMPPIRRYYEPNRARTGAVVVIVQQQVVILR